MRMLTVLMELVKAERAAVEVAAVLLQMQET
jgi:hypothetical protein